MLSTQTSMGIFQQFVYILVSFSFDSEYGQGFPVVFLHGNLNSRLFAPSWGKTEVETMAAGCRIIAIDRPGQITAFTESRNEVR